MITRIASKVLPLHSFVSRKFINRQTVSDTSIYLHHLPLS